MLAVPFHFYFKILKGYYSNQIKKVNVIFFVFERNKKERNKRKKKRRGAFVHYVWREELYILSHSLLFSNILKKKEKTHIQYTYGSNNCI